MSAAEKLDFPAEEPADARGSGRMRRPSAVPTSGLEDKEELSSPDLRPGDLIADRYEIDQVIGRGGHGAIHRARHRDLDLPVAVKVLHISGATGPHMELVQRFLREARMCARIRHRNVLSVHDTGRLADGSPFIVMELIEGEDLERRIGRGQIALPAIVDLGRQLYSGLTAIAEAGVLHRDVKPANVMLHRETDGHVLLKLVDFGIARTRVQDEKLTLTGAVVGTPHYMSPEQLRGEPLDARADMYSAAAVLYEATTGRPPFDGPATALVIGQILSASFVPVRTLRPDCPEVLAGIIEQGLSRRRADRPSHPMQVVAALDSLASAQKLPTGALAWAGDVAISGTIPIDLSRRRLHTPTQPGPEEPALPILPDEQHEPMREPERPDRIDDPPPSIPPRKALRGALALVGAIGVAVVAATFSMSGPDPIAAESPVTTSPPPSVNVVARPAEIDRLLQQGLEALARGEVDGALAQYRAAAALDPTRAEAQRGRGIAAARAGLDDEAIAAFESYLAIAPDASDAERVRARLNSVRTQRSDRLTHPPTVEHPHTTRRGVR